MSAREGAAWVARALYPPVQLTDDSLLEVVRKTRHLCRWRMVSKKTAKMADDTAGRLDYWLWQTGVDMGADHPWRRVMLLALVTEQDRWAEVLAKQRFDKDWDGLTEQFKQRAERASENERANVALAETNAKKALTDAYLSESTELGKAVQKHLAKVWSLPNAQLADLVRLAKPGEKHLVTLLRKFVKLFSDMAPFHAMAFAHAELRGLTSGLLALPDSKLVSFRLYKSDTPDQPICETTRSSGDTRMGFHLYDASRNGNTLEWYLASVVAQKWHFPHGFAETVNPRFVCAMTVKIALDGDQKKAPFAITVRGSLFEFPAILRFPAPRDYSVQDGEPFAAGEHSRLGEVRYSWNRDQRGKHATITFHLTCDRVPAVPDFGYLQDPWSDVSVRTPLVRTVLNGRLRPASEYEEIVNSGSVAMAEGDLTNAGKVENLLKYWLRLIATYYSN